MLPLPQIFFRAMEYGVRLFVRQSMRDTLFIHLRKFVIIIGTTVVNAPNDVCRRQRRQQDGVCFFAYSIHANADRDLDFNSIQLKYTRNCVRMVFG